MAVNNDFIKEKLKDIPLKPGIYKFLDMNNNVIYIGKSKCLRQRVSSYFNKHHIWEKTKKLVLLTHGFEYIVTDTHLEARLLECELIKSLKPYFNAQFKNDKEYVYLKVESYISKGNIILKDVVHTLNETDLNMFIKKGSLLSFVILYTPKLFLYRKKQFQY